MFTTLELLVVFAKRKIKLAGNSSAERKKIPSDRKSQERHLLHHPVHLDGNGKSDRGTQSLQRSRGEQHATKCDTGRPGGKPPTRAGTHS